MASTTGIEWANATWNPHYGCKKVSPGCAKCYMFRDMARFGRDPHIVTRASEKTFFAPLSWARNGKVKPGARIFTCSWSDWFIEQADEWRGEAWDVIRNTRKFNYLILTKRPERIAANLPPDWGDGYSNVWLGVSAETQKYADLRIPILLDIPARVRFISAEPLLGPLALRPPDDFSDNGHGRAWLGRGRIDWVITGGESDADPRVADPDWFRIIRDQCIESGAYYFHKQHGGKTKINGAWGGRELDGRTWSEFPQT